MKDTQPIIKSKKRFANKILASAMIIGLAVGSIFSFTGCNNVKDFIGDKFNNNTPSTSIDSSIDSSVQKPTPKPEPEPQPEPEVSITFDEFMEDYQDEAFAFVNNYVKNDILEGKTALSETWGFHANDNDELDSVSLTYTFANDTTSRIIEVANATFTNPIDLDKIVDGSVTENDAYSTITRQTAFEFSAKDNYLNSELANALYEKVGNDGNKCYTEIENENEGVRSFKIAEENSDAINVYVIDVVGETNEEVIANLNYSYNYEVSQFATYPLGDKQSTTINKSQYQIEEFTPANFDEAVKDYSSEISTALDTYFLESAGKASYGRTFDSSKLLSVTWDIGSGENISEIKMISTYEKSSTSQTYAIGKILLINPINVNSLTKDNIGQIFETASDNITTESIYSFQFNPEEQGTRDELVNAIFEAYGMTKECPEDAVRY